MFEDFFSRDITFVKNVGPQRAELLQSELRIFTVRDLLEYFPLRYEDRSRFYKVSDLKSSMGSVQCLGELREMRECQSRKGKRYLRAQFFDETGSLDLVWFKGLAYVKRSLKSGVRYVLFGSPDLFQGVLSVSHPELVEEDLFQKNIRGALQPVYRTTQRLTQKRFYSKVFEKIFSNIFKEISQSLPETLPGYILQKRKFISYGEALRQVHFPESEELLEKALFRFKFEELFYLQLHILSEYQVKSGESKGFVFAHVGEKFMAVYDSLPFSLTGAQKRVIREIRHDFRSALHSNRLLQGDVGSGKTLVSLLLMLIATDNGYQSCLMAPTEILAQQHRDTFSSFLKGKNVRMELLTGSTKESERRLLLEDLSKGLIDILIGTHALIEDRVVFKNLGFAVIDEQHRFGVMQRAKLWKKNTLPPHIMVMTATPIPRTLAMTLYGDLNVSVIDELPPGRKPVKTFHVYENQRKRVIDFLKKEMEKGQQVYVVFPLIYESESLSYKNLEEGVKDLRRELGKGNYEMSVLHGQMKTEEKEESMRRFVSGESQIMVATTVIEVGVNVPNASVMLIESAERFGLSQLHQLRGRVGRGADQSFCILMTDYKLSADSRKRMETMVATTDGFEIAEADLRLRGPGDMQSTRQSGMPFELKVSNLQRDFSVLEMARKEAKELLKSDPYFRNPLHLVVRKEMERRYKQSQGWGRIS